MHHRHHQSAGFSLVELLTVIGIISILIALLMPSLTRARSQAEAVQCMSNLRQTGMALQIYSNQWDGWLFPPELGANRPREQRWPVHVFQGRWNPPIMLCPSDFDPDQDHSYILNNHLAERGIKAGNSAGISSSEVILMGEKRSDWPDYYMNGDSNGPVPGGGGDYWTRVEPYRHGIRLSSNYLYVDGHVETRPPKEAQRGIDPWDIAVPLPPP